MRSSLLLPLIPGIHAWGQLGHATVAYIAQDLIAPATMQWAQNLLGNTNSSYMADIASWADSYRYTSAGHWSAPLHYIDANDSPPNSCSVDFNRDCGSKGCLVTAVSNYTSRVKQTSLGSEQTKEALEFLVHFTGDSTQPLHCENLDVGGNSISVTFGGTQTNLHAIWDTNMPEKLRGSFSLSTAAAWAQDLVTEIKTGNYSSVAPSWISGMDLNNPQATAMEWVTDSNTFDCSYVLKQSISYLESNDLSGSYYQGAIPIFSQQIAKGGYRLAAWLNLLATGSTQLGGGGKPSSSAPAPTSSIPASSIPASSAPVSSVPASSGFPSSSAFSAPSSAPASSFGGYSSSDYPPQSQSYGGYGTQSYVAYSQPSGGYQSYAGGSGSYAQPTAYSGGY